MNHLELVKLAALMELTRGRPEIVVGLIDGPVALGHPDLVHLHVREMPGNGGGACVETASAACLHGTFVAGVLFARRESRAPSICPECTMLVHPVFAETAGAEGAMPAAMPSAKPQGLAEAILACIDAGARLLNVSAEIGQTPQGDPALEEVLDHAARQGVLVIAAAGNQGTLGSSVITRHPWVVPVVAYDLRGRPMGESNLGNSIGRRGLGAPGEAVTSLAAGGEALSFEGTSAATPFVTGAAALIWSEFPSATAADIKFALTRAHSSRRITVVPPLLDAWAAYNVMRNAELQYARGRN